MTPVWCAPPARLPARRRAGGAHHTVLSIVLVLCAADARGAVAMAWSGATGTILVAHDDKIEAFNRTGERLLWSEKGLASPSLIVTTQDGQGAAVLDAFNDRVAVVSTTNGAMRVHDTPGTPVDAAFFGHDLWVVLRDRSSVLRITPEGEEAPFEVSLDPAQIAVSDRFVYVYSRADGLLQEIDPQSTRVTRTLAVGTAGSDLEIRMPRSGEELGAVAYLCRPGSGMVVTVNLSRMTSRTVNAGGAPVDLAFVQHSDTLVIADPKSQARDRISIGGAGIFGFDTASGAVHRIEGRTSTRVATGQTATSFVVTDDALFTWDATSGRPRRAPE